MFTHRGLSPHQFTPMSGAPQEHGADRSQRCRPVAISASVAAGSGGSCSSLAVRLSYIVGIVVLLALAALVDYSCRPIWQYYRLEGNAAKVVTSSELQAWATNLLAQYPSNVTLRASLLGTNFPQGLRSLAPEIGPSVRVNFPDDTNFPVGKGSTRRLEFKLSIGFVHPGGFMLGWFMGQMMEQGFRRLGCAN